MNYINLGKGKWHGEWLSKQDLIEYLRCEYRVYLSRSKGIPISEMKETILLQRLLEKGLEYEDGVVQNIQPIKVQNRESIEPLRKESMVIQVRQIFRNHDLGIQGIPDLINTEKGKFLPIEIKDHKEVYPTDELELAFYWLLLNPLRNKHAKARGYIVLNNDEIVEINITDDHLLEVEDLLDDIRDLDNRGSQPRLTQECKLCKIEKECREVVINSGGLTAIYNVSYGREHQFHEIGIKNMSDLMQIDEESTNNKLVSHFGNTPGTAELFRMKCHAHSIGNRKPVLFGKEDIFTALLSLPLLILDLEYDSESLIWLVGLCIKTNGKINYKQFFAEKANLDEERKLLDSLENIKRKYPEHLLVTYSGNSADLPQLKKASKRHEIYPHIYDLITKNHIDLYQLLTSNFRFPIASMRLSDMEEYLNIKRKSRIGSGLEALIIYNSYLRTNKDNKKKELRGALCEYNKDDVVSVLSIIENIPKLLRESVRINRNK